MAGVSRSVSLLLAYLIKQKNMKYNDAYDLVKRKRRIVVDLLFRFIQIVDLSGSSDNMN